MMTSLDQLVSSQRVLLLQGPMGDFFAQLAAWLRTRQIEVHKVNFNGGDRFFTEIVLRPIFGVGYLILQAG
mgnify:CR=1 FL=1